VEREKDGKKLFKPLSNVLFLFAVEKGTLDTRFDLFSQGLQYVTIRDRYKKLCQE
jgi:hypothetical protein